MLKSNDNDKRLLAKIETLKLILSSLNEDLKNVFHWLIDIQKDYKIFSPFILH
jgi:hypothetical protein